MRMFSFSSWISESRGSEEVANGGKSEVMVDVPSSLAVGVAKRKREDDWEPTAVAEDKSPVAKRRKQIAAKVGSNGAQKVQPAKLISTPTNMEQQNQIWQAIDTQLSLEILLKHNELRLIDQELAKSQIALEQLRRCHLIPFPLAQANPVAMEHVSSGTGPAIIPRQGDVRPQWAPPFGVTDGPYSRHYAKWLIPDPSFDGIQPEWDRNTAGARGGKSAMDGRTTRNSLTDNTALMGKARTHRGSTGQKLQALPSGYTQSKENAGPSTVKRADGTYVKLVCIDCGRENFGSTQGFINHCRIAHRREFKSHEEAAAASGQPIEVDEVGGIVGEERSVSGATGLVHPMIRNVPTDKAYYAALLSRINASLGMYHRGELPGVTSIPGSAATTPRKTGSKTPRASETFIPSTETPYLSNLLRNRGFDVNLGEMVDDAKKIDDLDDSTSHSEDSDVESRTPPHRGLGGLDGISETILPGMRVPARSAISPAPFGRPGSSKGPDGNKNSRKPGISPRLPYATPLNTSAAVINHNRSTFPIDEHPHTPEEDVDVSMRDVIDLSPNTITSNNAPSLVSDDGEYEDGDDAESSIESSEIDDDSSDVAEIDFEDGEGEAKVVSRSTPRRQVKNGGEGGGMHLRKEEKHVTFVSPVKETAKGRRRK